MTSLTAEPKSSEQKIFKFYFQYNIGKIQITTALLKLKFYLNVDRGSLNNYLMWQLAKSYMPYLSKPFQEAADLYRKSLTSAQKPLERWEFCEVTAERFFGHLMTSMYTKSRQFDQVIINLLLIYDHNILECGTITS